MKIRELARRMRIHSIEAEEFFWQRVRNRRLHRLKFLRQHVIAYPFDTTLTKYYIADFYCDQLKLIIELDGPIHQDLYEHDLIRTEHMESKGFHVLRFTNDEVLFHWPQVCKAIGQLQISRSIE